MARLRKIKILTCGLLLWLVGHAEVSANGPIPNTVWTTVQTYGGERPYGLWDVTKTPYQLVTQRMNDVGCPLKRVPTMMRGAGAQYHQTRVRICLLSDGYYWIVSRYHNSCPRPVIRWVKVFDLKTNDPTYVKMVTCTVQYHFMVPPNGWRVF